MNNKSKLIVPISIIVLMLFSICLSFFSKQRQIDLKDIRAKKSAVIFYSETGNTRKLAKKIADLTDSTIYEIEPLKPYKKSDLDYDNKKSIIYSEIHDKKEVPHKKNQIRCQKI